MYIIYQHFLLLLFPVLLVSLPVVFREHYMHAKAVTVTIVLLYYTFITQHTCHNKLHGPTDNSPPFGVFFTGVVWWTPCLFFLYIIHKLLSYKNCKNCSDLYESNNLSSKKCSTKQVLYLIYSNFFGCSPGPWGHKLCHTRVVRKQITVHIVWTGRRTWWGIDSFMNLLYVFLFFYYYLYNNYWTITSFIGQTSFINEEEKLSNFIIIIF